MAFLNLKSKKHETINLEFCVVSTRAVKISMRIDQVIRSQSIKSFKTPYIIRLSNIFQKPNYFSIFNQIPAFVIVPEINQKAIIMCQSKIDV